MFHVKHFHYLYVNSVSPGYECDKVQGVLNYARTLW